MQTLMHKTEDIQHSLLVVSSSEGFDRLIKQVLPRGRFMSVLFCNSASKARRCFVERFFDMVIIYSPLPDGMGTELAIDAAENFHAGVLFISADEVFEDLMETVTDHGVVMIPREAIRERLNKAIRLVLSIKDREARVRRELDKMNERLEEIKIIDKAKFYLIEKKKMTEDEAHRLIGKLAMDNGLSRRLIAEKILDDPYDIL